MELEGKRVVVIGTKRSGLGAIELLQKHGARVRAMDAQELTPEERAKFQGFGVPVFPQTQENLAFDGADPDLIVISPAVPIDLPMLAVARARGATVIGDIELASHFLQGPIIGITGSNGKTTTTALTGHVLRECGIPCQVGGNIGTSVCSMVDSSHPQQWNVLELSSFQLESIHHFRAQISAFLNITPDHLDRHRTFETYVNSKARLLETQTDQDYAVLNYDDRVCRELSSRTSAQVYWFSTNQAIERGAYLTGDDLFLNGSKFLRRKAVRLRGMHNVENVLASSVIASLAGAPADAIAPAVSSFKGVEHRIEFVRSLNGVEYFNDSKATNVDAALKAISAFDGNLWIILGGKDKGSDYSPLREPLRSRAKAAILIGADPPYPHAAAPLIRKALDGAVAVVNCGSIENAVQYARESAGAGDTVLLAPACASFDQFQNFEERGKRFKQLVSELS